MEILLLTRENCAFCHQAEKILARLSAEHTLSVTTLDLDTAEGQRVAERSGVMFPPGILIEGKLVCFGRPSERRLRRELQQRVHSPEARHAG